jgi:hypothetical protein
MAFEVPTEKREELRRQVIEQFGEKFELIVPPEEVEKNQSSRSRKRRRKRRSHRKK